MTIKYQTYKGKVLRVPCRSCGELIVYGEQHLLISGHGKLVYICTPCTRGILPDILHLYPGLTYQTPGL